MAKAECHYLIQCNYCGGFAHGRFSFIMFIQMFMLILACRFKHVLFFCCVRSVCGWMVEVCKLERKIVRVLEVLGCD